MQETLINGYLKIAPVEHTSFMMSQKETYEEVGIVVARDTSIEESAKIPIGSKVYFDSFMCKKYPIEGQDGKFQWFVHVSEIVKYEYEPKE